jgi:3-phosphoshikimate 1-carboxyvinyltransferase
MKKTPASTHGMSLSEEIKLLDKKIASLITHRTRLLAKSARSRKNKKVALADARQEQMLWQTWKEEMQREGVDHHAARRIFLQLNTLAYAQAERHHNEDKSFCLYPRKEAMDIAIEGPRSGFQARVMLFLAAASGQAVELSPFQPNDIAIELIKALNQCGGSLSWTSEACSVLPKARPDLDDKVIFTGQDRFNFYLLLCLALTGVHRVRFSGAANMKLLDLRPLADFLPELGARLTIVEPHGSGLPVRLETSGQLPSEIDIPEGLDNEFVLALAVCSLLFPGPTTLRIPAGQHEALFVQRGLRTLSRIGASIREQDGALEVTPGVPALAPVSRTLPMDPIQASCLLALPLLRGGSAELAGHWPADDAQASSIADILFEFGLKLHIAPNRVTMSVEQQPGALYLDLGSCPEYLPVALGLSLAVPGKVTLAVDPGLPDMEYAVDMLQTLHVEHAVTAEGIDILGHNGRKGQEISWVSPGPVWTLGYVLASFALPGICLANPGNITTLWPGFWGLFKNLPQPQNARPKTPQGDGDDRPKRRRIRI